MLLHYQSPNDSRLNKISTEQKESLHIQPAAALLYSPFYARLHVVRIAHVGFQERGPVTPVPCADQLVGRNRFAVDAGARSGLQIGAHHESRSVCSVGERDRSSKLRGGAGDDGHFIGKAESGYQ